MSVKNNKQTLEKTERDYSKLVIKRHKFPTPQHPMVFNQPSMTKQSFTAECDVNNILAKYRKTGLIHHLAKHLGSYEDVSTAPDYQTALNVIIESEESFNLLPAEIRRQFSNDPAQFLDFVHDPKNKDKMIEMGLMKKPVFASQNDAPGVVSEPSSDTAPGAKNPAAE